MNTSSYQLRNLWPALLVLLLGCTAARAERATLPQLQLRSSFDLACPYTQLSLVHFDRRSKGVSGCGRQVSYVEDCQQIDGRQSCTWVMDSLPRAQGQAAPPQLPAPLPSPAPTYPTAPPGPAPMAPPGVAPTSPAAPPGPAPTAPPRPPSSDLKPPDWDTRSPNAPPPGLLDSRH